MSLVVACKRDGVIYMGADTQTTAGTMIERNLNESGFKISRLPNGMLIGVCGRAKGHQRIVAQKDWFDVPDIEAFDKRYIVKNIIPKLSVLMKNIKDDKDSRTNAMTVCLIIAWQDKMFMISRNFEVFECDNCIAIGAGAEFARYELSQIQSDNINEGLLKALRMGSMFNSTVSAPYILIDTKDKEYKIVEG